MLWFDVYFNHAKLFNWVRVRSKYNTHLSYSTVWNRVYSHCKQTSAKQELGRNFSGHFMMFFNDESAKRKWKSFLFSCCMRWSCCLKLTDHATFLIRQHNFLFKTIIMWWTDQKETSSVEWRRYSHFSTELFTTLLLCLALLHMKMRKKGKTCEIEKWIQKLQYLFAMNNSKLTE